MRKELDEKLCTDYPNIFRDRYGNVHETAMCWGFDIGDGWYDILDVLCLCLSNDIKYNRMPDVVATQVKEKFGELRFYYFGGDDRALSYADMAMAMSRRICEICGHPGRIDYDVPWLKCRCPEHLDV